jgi:hypothetical protein
MILRHEVREEHVPSIESGFVVSHPFGIKEVGSYVFVTEIEGLRSEPEDGGESMHIPVPKRITRWETWIEVDSVDVSCDWHLGSSGSSDRRGVVQPVRSRLNIGDRMMSWRDCVNYLCRRTAAKLSIAISEVRGTYIGDLGPRRQAIRISGDQLYSN